MSLQLLKQLKGEKNGLLKKYIDKLDHTPNIAWYPSAGQDFRALMYLSREYSGYNKASEEETCFPELFIFSDYFPWDGSNFLDSKLIYEDTRTKVEILDIELLPDLNLPYDSEIIAFKPITKTKNRAVFMNVKVTSHRLGVLVRPVIYCFAVNEAFCSLVLLKNDAEISHLVHVRYGEGFGGSCSTGYWLRNILKKMKIKIYISRNGYHVEGGDIAALRLYPNLRGSIPSLRPIRTITYRFWSGYGNLDWNIIE